MQHSTHQTLMALSLQGFYIHLIGPKQAEAHSFDKQLPFKVTRVGGDGYLSALKRAIFMFILWRRSSYDYLLLLGHKEEIAFGCLSRLYPVKPITLAAGTRLHFPGNRLKKFIRNKILKNCYFNSHKIIVTTEETTDYINAYCNDINVPIEQIPRPINDQIWKRKRSKSNPQFILITVCRLEIEKHVNCVIELAAELKHSIPNLEYWIIGDGKCKAQLDEKIKKTQSESFIKLFGAMSQKETVELVQDADIFVLLSKWESFGRVYVEAAALGVPSIAFRVGGVKYAVENNVSGYLFPEDDVQSVKYKVEHLYSHPDELEKLKISSAAYFQKNFTLKIVGEKFKKVLIDG